MKFISFTGDDCDLFRHDYNTNNFSEAVLRDLCHEWERQDAPGIFYFLKEVEE